MSRHANARVPDAEVEIESIAAGGEGVGRLADGRVVFVHRTAPGDRARVRIEQQRRSWARGSVVSLARESEQRRPAPCPHYARCGGCTLEHLVYPAQLHAKGRIVQEALRRIGGATAELPAVVASPLEFRYRNRVSFSLRRLAGGRVVAGFHALGEPGRIVPIDGGCLLPEAPIGRAWDELRAAWGPDAERLPSGERLRLTLRASAAGRVSLLVEGGYGPGRPGELLEKVDLLDSVWHRPENAPASLAAGAPGLPETWGAERFELSGSAFLQVNRAAAALLEEHVLALAGALQGRTVVDAYCGIALHGRRLARGGAEVTAIELDAEAARIAAEAGQPGLRVLQGTVEQHLSAALPAELVILNPPRAGVSEAVAEQLLAGAPARIIYISCDPATLARDVKRLRDRYRLGAVRCFDLFPQTAHVETVAELVIHP